MAIRALFGHPPKANMRTPCVLRLLPLRTGSDLHLQLSSAPGEPSDTVAPLVADKPDCEQRVCWVDVESFVRTKG